ncbi:unnamed protein product, partial [Closterium sp. NIES-53]
SVVTDPSLESAAVPALVAELVDIAAASRLDYTACLVAESDCPPSVGGECALGTDVLTHVSGRQPWTQRWHPRSPQALT